MVRFAVNYLSDFFRSPAASLVKGKRALAIVMSPRSASIIDFEDVMVTRAMRFAYARASWRRSCSR
jgi:hypothetical protein